MVFVFDFISSLGSNALVEERGKVLLLKTASETLVVNAMVKSDLCLQRAAEKIRLNMVCC